MKKLLILAYDFPPYVSVGGLRPYSWHQYLKEFGVEPIVVTRQWGNEYGDARDYIAPSKSDQVENEVTEFGTIIRSPYKPNMANKLYLKYGENKYSIIRKMLSAFYKLKAFYHYKNEKSSIYFAAKNYLKNTKVDAILATGEPFVLFSYAHHLSKSFDIPWIADYRDPWSQEKTRSTFLFTYLFPKIEKRLLKNVTVAITVSEFLRKKISPLLPPVPFHILINGYNPESISMISSIDQKSDVLRIAFAGTIYDWHPWKEIIHLFEEWRKMNSKANIEIHFFGVNIENELRNHITTNCPTIKNHVKIFSKLPNPQLLKEIKTYNALLLFNDYSIVGTKIFDYLALKRKIIFCYENDKDAILLKKKYYAIEELANCSKRLQAEVIEVTNSGVVVQNKEHLFIVFDQLWAEFQETGKIVCNSINTEQYSRKIQTEKLAQIIHQLT